MKTISCISPALLISALLLNGCSGLDDPDDGGGSTTPSVFTGSYDLVVELTAGCPITTATGTMTVDVDGVVTSTTLDNGSGDYTFSGNINEITEFINGDLNFTPPGITGTFDGNMSTSTIIHCGITPVTGGGGNWGDSLGCSGTWTACP